jgi:hypothetical protein
VTLPLISGSKILPSSGFFGAMPVISAKLEKQVTVRDRGGYRGILGKLSGHTNTMARRQPTQIPAGDSRPMQSDAT